MANEIQVREQNQVATGNFSMSDLEMLSKKLANSDLVPKDYKGKPDNCFVAIMHGQKLGLDPFASLAGIAVINGRASIWGDAMLALVQAHPDCEDIVEEFDSKTMTATCTVKRRGRTPVVRTFTKQQAEKAGLWGRNTWASYPERMLQMRARGFALRDAFPDALKGLHMAEEQQDVVLAATFEEKPEPGKGVKGLKAALGVEEPAKPESVEVEVVEPETVKGRRTKPAKAEETKGDLFNEEPEGADEPDDPRLEVASRIAAGRKTLKWTPAELLKDLSEVMGREVKRLSDLTYDELTQYADALEDTARGV